jgi:hypothetical protein
MWEETHSIRNSSGKAFFELSRLQGEDADYRDEGVRSMAHQNIRCVTQRRKLSGAAALHGPLGAVLHQVAWWVKPDPAVRRLEQGVDPNEVRPALKYFHGSLKAYRHAGRRR